jgi:hypothetical protein
MPRQFSPLPPVAVLLACLVAIPACKKQQPEGDSAPPATEPGTDPNATVTPPSTPERERTLKKFQQVGLGLLECEGANSQVPIHSIGEDGIPLVKLDMKPLLSWRVAILPFMNEKELYKEFNFKEPWDSPHNKALIEKMPKAYAPEKPGKPGYTHVQMVIGPKALDSPVLHLNDPDTVDTIAVVEAAEPVIWTKPADVMFPDNELPKDFRKKFGGQFPGGFHAMLWNGKAKFIPDTVSDSTLALAINPRRTQPLPKDW